MDDIGSVGNPNYDISPDGEFIFVEQDPRPVVGDLTQINVVLNWTQELLERVPVP